MRCPKKVGANKSSVYNLCNSPRSVIPYNSIFYGIPRVLGLDKPSKPRSQKQPLDSLKLGYTDLAELHRSSTASPLAPSRPGSTVLTSRRASSRPGSTSGRATYPEKCHYVHEHLLNIVIEAVRYTILLENQEEIIRKGWLKL